jgi:hypothetical protein
MAKLFSFDELDGAMSKIDSLGSVMTKNSYSKIDEWIGTGNYLLNAQISGSVFKGIPNSRSIVFSGVSGCLHPDTKLTVFVSEEKTSRRIEEVD